MSLVTRFALPLNLLLTSQTWAFVPQNSYTQQNRINENDVIVPHEHVLRINENAFRNNEAFKAYPYELKVDERTQAVRLISKINSDSYKSRDLKLASLIETSLHFIKSHPELIPINLKNIQPNLSSVLIQDKEQFLSFKVLKRGIVVDDAAISMRFKFRKLVEVANHSFAEAKSIQTPTIGNAYQLMKEHYPQAEIKRLKVSYRVRAHKRGYELVKVRAFKLRTETQSFTAQLDLHSGKILQVLDDHLYIAGKASADTYPRWYNQDLTVGFLPNLDILSGQTTLRSLANGTFQLPKTDPAPTIPNGLRGKHSFVINKSGEPIKENGIDIRDEWVIHVAKNETTPNHMDESVAQVMIYEKVDEIVTKARNYIHTPWFDQPLMANANINSSCNAYWNGTSINFYKGNNQCANTGLISDVVYHEWGHGLDHKTGGIADGAFSEGFGDIMSMIMTHSSTLGIGFRVPNHEPVRELSIPKVYPRDAGGGVHSEGLIIGSTFWDLFQALTTKFGEDTAGDMLANYAFKMIFTARTYLDVYNAILVIDDDDDDLANGTPNLCLINEVFQAHGLAQAEPMCALAALEGIVLRDENQSGAIDPGETVKLNLIARNARPEVLSGLVGTVTIDSPLVEMINSTVNFADIATGSTQTSTESVELTVSSEATCGTKLSADIQFAHAGNSIVINREFQIGTNAGQTETTTASQLPVPILDRHTATALIPVESSQWDADTKVGQAILRFHINHTYIGDLIIHLRAPDGTRHEIFRGRGNVDDLDFDQDLTELFKDSKGKGTWELQIYDRADADQGSLDSLSFDITPARFECTSL